MLDTNKTAPDATERTSIPKTFLQEIRSLLPLLLVLVLGMVAMRFLLIKGTLFDKDTTPNWAQEDNDINTVRRAIERGDLPTAERRLNALLVRQPNYGRAHEMLGYIYLQRDQHELALKHYQKATEYEPDDGRIQKALEIIKRKIER